MTTDDDRVAYLSGDAGAPLDPDERAALDDLRALLDDPSLWEEPDPALEDRVVAAVGAEAGTRSAPAPRRPRRLFLLVAAAAVVVVGLAAGVLATRPSGRPYRVALAATAGNQAAGSGQVTFSRTTSGWRIELRAPSLPRLDGGRFYEAWMEDGAGTRVAVGTFNEGRRVTLWSGVSPKAFPVVTVTAEQAGGRGGPTVLAGQVKRPD
ncbi:MAG TPA: anti-sigma factor [Acidimicrobiales bacterium]|nr:anti-sigma factor [Acidimicrobiales bacterium]